MITYNYNLPEITFVGGESQELAFNLYTPNYYPFDMEADERIANFSIIHYANRDYETPILAVSSTDSQPQVIIQNGKEGVLNRVLVSLRPSDTLYLSGKYIYQLTLTNSSGEVADIPSQGILYINRNINPNFLS